MKKNISKLLLVIMMFSFIFESNLITGQAAKIEDDENQIQSESIIKENTKKRLGADYRKLYSSNNLELLNVNNENEITINEKAINATSNSSISLTGKTVNSIIMLIDFPQSESDPNKGKLNINKSYSKAKINGLDSAIFGAERSVKDYFNKVSNGKCTVNPVTLYNNVEEGQVYVYTANHPIGYYKPYSSSNTIGYKDGYYDRTTLITDALEAYKKYIPSDLDLDVNNDGNIDSAMFFVPSEGGWDQFLWSYAFEVIEKNHSVNGARLYYYNQITYPQVSADLYKDMVHELMHIVGFPDMYEYGSGTFKSPFDSWTPMTGGVSGYPTVWERSRYGDNWISPNSIKTIEKDGQYELSSSTSDSNKNTIAYKIDIENSNEFFMVEYRNKNANVYEKDIPNTGIIVYRVNPDRIGNSSGDPELYQLRNEGKECRESYLDGTSGHQSIELKTYSGETVGVINYVKKVGDKVVFELDQDISIKSLTLKSSTGKEFANNQCTEGSYVYLNANVEKQNGNVNYLYTIEDSKGNIKTISNSNDSSAKWYANKAGQYKVKLTVKDEKGCQESKEIAFTVNEGISLKSASFNEKSPQTIGTKIVANVSFEGGTGSKKCLSIKATGGNYQFGSKEVYFSMTSDSSGEWIPDTDGNYKIYATVRDEAGSTKLFCIGEMEIEKRQTTIYYNGYDNPYIHYKIGNGTWTSAPGIKMNSNSDLDGYNYAITIDLGDAEQLIACFNNGNGSWDSNNGKNYTFRTGYYTYNNGAITKIEKPKKQLKIDSITSKLGSSYVSGNQNVFTAQVSNGEGKVQYQFEYKNNTTGDSGVLRNYSQYSTLSTNLGAPGQYTLTVKVKDEAGNTDSKTLDFTIEEYKKLDIKSVTSSLGDNFQKGKTTQLTINATGGKGNKYYSIEVNGKSILNESSSNNVSWTPTEAGTYRIVASVSEAQSGSASYTKTITVEDKVSNQTTIYYKGYDNPYIHYRIGNGAWTNAPGVKMSSNSDVDGYNYAITLDLGDADQLTACFNNGSSSWDSNGGNNYTFKAGYYTYSNGVITKIEKPSSELKINSITCSSGSTIKMGSTVDLTVNASGGEGPYTYTLYYSAYGSGRTNYIIKEQSNNTGKFTPDYPRETTIYAEVVDSTGKRVTYSQTFNVKENTSNQTTIYYKGYDNPYIHYKIGNGAWTNAPGVKMEKTSEKPGYGYKITIDLGDANNITACFNNGNGSWDSNNGNNYTFGVGNYTYSNGTINKIN